jgi:hypothetical protein
LEGDTPGLFFAEFHSRCVHRLASSENVLENHVHVQAGPHDPGVDHRKHDDRTVLALYMTDYTVDGARVAACHMFR